MSANITTVNGKFHFTRRAGSSAPWWSKTTNETSGDDIAQWLTDAFLDYSLERVPFYTQSQGMSDVGGFDVPFLRTQTASDIFAVVRTDTGAYVCSVGPHTTLLQNRFAFRSFQPFLDAGLARLETAMGLDDDKRVVITAEVIGATQEIVKGDAVACNIALAHAHDNSLSVHSMLTPVRIVCQNTLRMAIDDERSRIIKIRHGRDVETKVTEAQANIADAIALFNQNCDNVYRPMSKTPINAAGAKEYFKRVFGFKPNPETKKFATRTQNSLDALMASFDREVNATNTILEMAKELRQREERDADIKADENKQLLEMCLASMEGNAKGANVPGVLGTVWGAYNAVTDILTHDRGRNAQSLVNSNLFGPNAKTNDKAIDIAMEMVNVGSGVA